MKIDCISDLHGFYPTLEGGDLLIVAGDLTARDEIDQYCEFFDWLIMQNYSHKVLIAGNHDNSILDGLDFSFEDERIHYLEDDGIEIEGLKIWGVPYSLWFSRINSKCAAFTGDEEYLKSKYELIPNDIDILVSHTPAYGILDENIEGEHCGSKSLLEAIQRIKPRLVVHGHIHEQGSKIIGTSVLTEKQVLEIRRKYPEKSGIELAEEYGVCKQTIYNAINEITFVNASHVNEYYQPVNEPIRVELL